jgi:hypothetical protein
MSIMTKRIKAALVLFIGLALLPALLWAETPSQQPKQPQQQQQPQQQPQQVRPIKERPMYTSAVEKLKLDAKQAKAFEGIIDKATKKAKDALPKAKDDTARREIGRTYFADIYGQLKGLLRPNQMKLYDDYMQQLKEYFQNRQNNQ